MVNRRKSTKTTKKIMLQCAWDLLFPVFSFRLLGISHWRPFKMLMFVVSAIRFSGHSWRLRAVFCGFDFYMFYGLCHLGSGAGMKLRI